ncbi:hypothetical protein BpHYR1_023463 [Brachionus plicatilis]|uniref:HTH CENPB-type domain-containing protein n=1 Tax=Brachionus plicatilis TaxID=10195 RepID=A0A3M7PWH8_BRAPC|nr:hypothetical protein BpHYR1_023463 [Brachionus plicatilis]
MLILENSISDSSSASSNSSPVGNEPQPESSPVVEELQSESSPADNVIKPNNYPEMDSKLLEWFDEQRKQNLSIQSWQIKNQASIIFDQLYMNTPSINVFQASAGWLYGWLRRHNKTLRRVTTTGRELPSYSKV